MTHQQSILCSLIFDFGLNILILNSEYNSIRYDERQVALPFAFADCPDLSVLSKNFVVGVADNFLVVKVIAEQYAVCIAVMAYIILHTV